MLKRFCATVCVIGVVGLATAAPDPPGTLKSYQDVEAFFKGKTVEGRIKTAEGSFIVSRKGGKATVHAVIGEISEDEARALMLLQFAAPSSVPRLRGLADMQRFIDGAGSPVAVYCSFQDSVDSLWIKKGDRLILATREGKTYTVPLACWDDAFQARASTICSRTTGLQTRP